MNYSQFNQTPFNAIPETGTSCNLLSLDVATFGLLSAPIHFSESVALLGLSPYCAEVLPTFEPIPIGSRRSCSPILRYLSYQCR